jgi:hypothetical protein
MLTSRRRRLRLLLLLLLLRPGATAAASALAECVWASANGCTPKISHRCLYLRVPASED